MRAVINYSIEVLELGIPWLKIENIFARYIW